MQVFRTVPSFSIMEIFEDRYVEDAVFRKEKLIERRRGSGNCQAALQAKQVHNNFSIVRAENKEINKPQQDLVIS